MDNWYVVQPGETLQEYKERVMGTVVIGEIDFLETDARALSEDEIKERYEAALLNKGIKNALR